MRDRLVAGAGEVQVPEGVVVGDAEVGAALGGDVDVAVSREGRAGYPEPVRCESSILVRDSGRSGSVVVTRTYICCWRHHCRVFSGMVSKYLPMVGVL